MKHLHWFLAGSLMLLPLPAVAAPAAAVPTNSSAAVEVDVAKAKVFEAYQKISRVSVADPTIADVTVFSRTGVLILGKRQGSTTVNVWTAGGSRIDYDVTVNVDTQLIRQSLMRALLTDEIRADMANDRLVISGRVSHPSQVELAGKIAEGFASKVVNLVQATPAPQIEVEVKVAELIKTNGHDAGVSWGSMRETKSGDILFRKDSMAFAETSGPPFGARNILSFGQFDRLAAELKLLATEGKARVLAEPKLVVTNGASASVLVGGEFPVPIAQQLGQVTVLWRGYGVKLEVGALINPDGRITMRVRPEVSQLDFNNAIKIAGFTLPSLRSRWTETQVVLAPGEALGISGLTQTTETEMVDKFPLLGDIPVLGYLFSTTRMQKEDTELTIFVSPKLVAATRPPAKALEPGHPAPRPRDTRGQEPPRAEQPKAEPPRADLAKIEQAKADPGRLARPEADASASMPVRAEGHPLDAEKAGAKQ
ncbi:MAG: pilus assembly protein N-terminal domain-containing protein [Candidatus Sericytochromatia bacterium]|nr:pilus assembly protein N-terminal domain-containing protein [Candidatus Tanganyikabacteria bacterium]